MALTIGQVTKSTGIAARTIRFYETAAVLPALTRTMSGHRQCTIDAIEISNWAPRST